jgi:hypothetical protein
MTELHRRPIVLRHSWVSSAVAGKEFERQVHRSHCASAQKAKSEESEEGMRDGEEGRAGIRKEIEFPRLQPGV